MTLRARLERLEGRHSERDLPPVVWTVPVFGDDDHGGGGLGPPGEYRSVMPNGRVCVCKVVDVFAEGGVPCDPE